MKTHILSCIFFVIGLGHIPSSAQVKVSRTGFVLSGFNQFDFTPFNRLTFQRDDQARIGLLGVQWYSPSKTGANRLGLSTYWRQYQDVDVLFVYRPSEYNIEKGSYFGFGINAGHQWDLNSRWSLFTDAIYNIDMFYSKTPGAQQNSKYLGIQSGLAYSHTFLNKYILNYELGGGASWGIRRNKWTSGAKGIAYQRNIKVILRKKVGAP